MNGSTRRMACLVVALLAVAAVAVAQDHPDNPAAPEDGTMPTAENPRVGFTFGRDLDRETRALTGAGEAFPPDVGQVWCLTRVEGLTPPATVTHVWYHDGETRARIDLPIGSQNWRTWSSKKILAAWTGTWEVKVLDADGTVLGSASFEIREP